VAGSLEFLPVQWLIGQKVYEPQKMRVYLESMWKRLMVLDKNKAVFFEPDQYQVIVNSASRITIELRRIKKQIDENQDSLKTAVKIFDLLHVLSISFFGLYFSTLCKGMITGNERIHSKAS
jgi:predicted membrane protein